jgi:hypothetical protein
LGDSRLHYFFRLVETMKKNIGRLSLSRLAVWTNNNIDNNDDDVGHQREFHRIRFSMLNVRRNGNLINLPVFLCDWLKELLSEL